MADHAEQLVGTLFRVLSEADQPEVQRALLNTYQSHATTDRGELTTSLFSELLTVLHEQTDSRTQADILITALERLLNRFTAVVEAAPVAILVVDEDDNIQIWNDGAERIFGWSDSEVHRETYSEVFTSPPEATESPLDRLQQGEQLHGIETQHADRNGTLLDVRIWATPIQTRDVEFSGGVFVISDITEQKQREQRLSVLNRVLRHNIRNDVNVIQGHLEMLDDQCSTDDEHVQVMDERLSDIVELSQTARHIEQLQRDRGTDCVTIDLGEMLRERIERLRSPSGNVDVSCEVPETLPVVAHELLPYAFDNVLDNAIEHNTAEKPRVEVTTELRDSGNTAVVSVADNGPGLPATERKVLASETETSLNHSSGMGLWLSHWIVRSSDGSITVEESEFGGTRVSVRLRTRPDS